MEVCYSGIMGDPKRIMPQEQRQMLLVYLDSAHAWGKNKQKNKQKTKNKTKNTTQNKKTQNILHKPSFKHEFLLREECTEGIKYGISGF